MTEILDILTTVANGIDWEQTTLGAVASTLLGGVAWLARKLFASKPMSILAHRVLGNIETPEDYDLDHHWVAFTGGRVVLPMKGRHRGYILFDVKKNEPPQDGSEHFTEAEKKAIFAKTETVLSRLGAEERESRREAALKALRDK